MTNSTEILYEMKHFYYSLYSRSNCFPGPAFVDLTHPSLNEDESISCEGVLTLDEGYRALVAMSNDKSPGSDGLTVNFYKVFWQNIGNLVVDSLNYGYQRGFLSPEQSRGIITLIPKPDNDPISLVNYRPITLLNSDYT